MKIIASEGILSIGQMLVLDKLPEGEFNWHPLLGGRIFFFYPGTTWFVYVSQEGICTQDKEVLTIEELDYLNDVEGAQRPSDWPLEIEEHDAS